MKQALYVRAGNEGERASTDARAKSGVIAVHVGLFAEVVLALHVYVCCKMEHEMLTIDGRQ